MPDRHRRALLKTASAAAGGLALGGATAHLVANAGVGQNFGGRAQHVRCRPGWCPPCTPTASATQRAVAEISQNATAQVLNLTETRTITAPQ